MAHGQWSPNHNNATSAPRPSGLLTDSRSGDRVERTLDVP